MSVVGEIERWLHWHPSVVVEEQSNEADHKAYCSGCGDLLSGPCFTCALCNHRLDQKCAYAPYRIRNHPLHPHHSGFSLCERPPPDSDHVYGCALCKEKRDMFFYKCRDCPFSLDIKCFNSSSSFEPSQESKLDFHQHPLTLIETPMDELEKRFSCAWCHEQLLDAMYFCVHCPTPFVFHKKCLDELPPKIHHPSHHLHPLSLEPKNNDFLCKLCRKQHSGYFYSCSQCLFHIHIECARPMSVVDDKSHHQHPFTLFWRQGSFTCDACDTEGEYISYICSTCCVIVHKDCTKLPRIIKFSRHEHCLFHNYFLEKQELARQDCRICFEQVKLERGSYSCVKAAGCNYVVHVKCALKDKNMYDVIEHESQCEEIYAATQPSIVRVIERNEAGEATKIEHFSHEGHCLVLADKSKEEIDRNCHGCTLSISGLFYSCSESECHFYLHKTCAELPRINRHWLDRSNAILESKGIEQCSLCHRWCSGFFYNIGRFFDVCLQCAQVPDIIELEAHQHLLSFDFNCQDRCNGCGGAHGGNGAFKCGKCSFVLDFACLTLPHSAPHKIDQHMLDLTYHDDNDYEEHWYCDICETERDRGLWYYNCLICDTTVHPNCVLGKFPFVNDGASRPHLFGHYHYFLFFRKVEGYPECTGCGEICLEEVFQCEKPTCNFIVHSKCVSYF